MSVAAAPPLASPSLRTAPSAQVPIWLYLLFFASGISGLLYEVVWVRMLTRVLGHTVYATATVLAAFMAGLAVGSFLIGKYIDASRRPLRWYGFLELGIGLSALLSLVLPERLVPLYRIVYDLAGGSRAWLTAGQVLFAFVILLVPTALMGATLPTLSAFMARRRRDFGRYVGVLYALNTLGAVVGVLAGGLVLIGAIGEIRTIAIGVVLNLLVAAVALLMARRSSPEAGPMAAVAPAEPVALAECGPVFSARVRRVVVLSFALSGLAALANEVIWSRMLPLYQGSSIYAFSTMLAVMLAGMGLGSFVGARLLHRCKDPLRLLAQLQLGLGLAEALALLLFMDLEDWPFRIVLAPLVCVGPLGLLSGVAFPVTASCYTCTPPVAGRGIARLYAWNTLGCIVGALAGGFVLIPLLGVSRSAFAVAGLSFLLGVLLLAVHPSRLRRRVSPVECLLAGGAAGVAVVLYFVGDPYYYVLQERMVNLENGDFTLYRQAETADATTTAFGFRKRGGTPPRTVQVSAANAVGLLAAPGGQGPLLTLAALPPEHLHKDIWRKELWINGHPMTTLVTGTKLMAHLPLWLTDNPHDILVVCFGMGTTVRSATRHEGVEVWTVELVPTVLECFGNYHADGPELLRRPNVHAIADDGRNYLLMNQRQYDVITMDPAPPLYSAGTVNLYSREFFELCRQRLRPGGIMCLWIQPASYTEVRMIVRTFLDVFAHVQVFAGPDSDLSGLLLLGSQEPLRNVEEKIRAGYRQKAVREDLLEWGFTCDRPEKILKLYLTDEVRLREFVRDVPVISDDRPYTEFPLWRALLDREDYKRQLDAEELRRYLKER